MKSLQVALKEILVPIETVSEVKNGKKKQRDRKFYPGYVFVEMNSFDDLGSFKESSLVQRSKKQMALSILSVKRTLLHWLKMRLAAFLAK